MAAFNQIVDWKGGVISEVPVPHETPHTIKLDWQVLLMEAVRSIDETRGTEPAKCGRRRRQSGGCADHPGDR